MKKKAFFLSSLVAVALFVGAMSFTSCDKEDVDYDSMNTPTYVVYPDDPKYDSHTCPWCEHVVTTTEGIHAHYYGPAATAEALWCSDPHCPFHPDNPRNDRPTVPRNHRHVFYVSDLAFGGQYHYGGQVGHIGF